MVADFVFVTTEVLTVKVALVLPANTVTDTGTLAAVLLLLSVTMDPPIGAGLFKATSPVELAPPIKLVGLRLNMLRAGGFKVNVAVIVAPPQLAVIVTDTLAVTAHVVIVKVAAFVPAATVTDAGTVAAVLLLLSKTVDPSRGARPLSVTVPAELLAPVTLVGLRLNVLSVGGPIVNTAIWVAPL
jgi:hypothetical protein